MSAGGGALALPHGAVALPAFLPDATLGVVRAVDATDLLACGVQALVMNAFHLMRRPGSSTVQALGGLHAMAGWPGPIVTDSGGFQAYSLIHENPHNGRIDDRGITFRPDGGARKFFLTPEKTVQLQLGYGTDVVVCLDDCTHVDAPPDEQRAAVRRTVAWARRCKAEYERLLAQRRAPAEGRPRLFAVIQGGGDRDLRRECAEALLAIGFDGYGYGGWPLDGQGNLLAEIIAYTRELVPREFPLHALGVGHPRHVATCAGLGYALFDSALPTRDARHGRLYAWREGEWPRGDWLRFVYVGDEKHTKAAGPVDPTCDGLCCARYSLGYLRHLFKIDDGLYPRLATIHNLRFMARLMARLRGCADGRTSSWVPE